LLDISFDAVCFDACYRAAMMSVFLCCLLKDVCLENYIALPDDSCGVTASLDAALSVVPPTLGLRPKPFDEAGFDV